MSELGAFKGYSPDVKEWVCNMPYIRSNAPIFAQNEEDRAELAHLAKLFDIRVAENAWLQYVSAVHPTRYMNPRLTELEKTAFALIPVPYVELIWEEGKEASPIYKAHQALMRAALHRYQCEVHLVFDAYWLDRAELLLKHHADSEYSKWHDSVYKTNYRISDRLPSKKFMANVLDLIYPLHVIHFTS